MHQTEEQDIQVHIHHLEMRERDAELALARGVLDQVQVQSQRQLHRLYSPPRPPNSPHSQLSNPIPATAVTSSRPPKNAQFVRGKPPIGPQHNYSSGILAPPTSNRI